MELKYFLILVVIIIIECTISYISEINYLSYNKKINKNGNKIFDIGFNYIPKISDRYNFIDDLLVFFPLLLLLFININYKKYILSLIFIQVLRSICLYLTVYPPANINCEKNVIKKEKKFNLVKICTGRCTETIFSNHTSLLLLTLIYLFPKMNYFSKIFSVFYFLVTIYIIIGLRNHYTIDIFLGIIITFLVTNSIDKFKFLRI